MRTKPSRPFVLMIAASFLLAMIPVVAAADPCVVPEGPPGTVTLPPVGCEYLSPAEVHVIVNGLPPSTTIELAPIHKDFICDPVYSYGCTIVIPPSECEAPGGTLAGNGDCFGSTIELQATGTGLLAGFSRLLTLQLDTEVHTGPRTPGDPVQTFPTEMFLLTGQLTGDPDFDLLKIRAGSAFALPSPGSTTLTDLGGGLWNVDSFFDITYEIEFQGAVGGDLAGMAGTTQASIKMQAGEPAPANPCTVPEGPPGTITLPPAGCEYLSPDEVHMILNGLPPGTTIELAAIHKDFFCDGLGGLLPPPVCSVVLPPDACEGPGGSLGGSLDCFDSFAELEVSGTGGLNGFTRTITIPFLNVEVHTGPRTPGDPVQDFDSDMIRLDGTLFGDPDFDFLRIRAGSDFGLPSPGHTTLTDLGVGAFQVDSFFDITYTIEFQGAPGGALAGLAGITQGQIRMQTGNPAQAPVQMPTLSGAWIVVLGVMLAGAGTALVALRSRARRASP